MTACVGYLHRRWIQGEFFLPMDGETEVQTQNNFVASKDDTQQPAQVDVLAQESVAFDSSDGVADLFLEKPTVEVSENKLTPIGKFLVREIDYPASLVPHFVSFDLLFQYPFIKV